jgi:hypothetical protein
MKIRDGEISIVERGGEVSGGATSLAASDWAIVNDDDCAPSARQEVGGGHTGNAGADDADIGSQILRQWLELWHVGCAHPDRRSAARIALHGLSDAD